MLILAVLIFSLAVFLILSKRNIALAMFSASTVLGVTVSPIVFLDSFVKSFTTIRILALAIATGLIPVIGGLMNDTGLMDELISNLNLGKRSIIGLTPALFGLLPMPGGALLSAPVLDKVENDTNTRDYIATANVWFRHIFILIYPMSAALIISTEVAKVNMYDAILYLLIFSFISIIIGYLSLLKKIPNDNYGENNRKLRVVFKPLMILLIAPVIDFTIRFFKLAPLLDYSIMIGVLTSFILLLFVAKPNYKSLKKVSIIMKPWNFFFLMIGISFYLNVFLASPVPVVIKGMEINKLILLVIIPFSLGFFTGRVYTPASILYPIFIAKFGQLSPLFFAVTYVNIFMGYIISPVHPCLVLTADYFKKDVKVIVVKSAPLALTITLISTLMISLM